MIVLGSECGHRFLGRQVDPLVRRRKKVQSILLPELLSEELSTTLHILTRRKVLQMMDLDILVGDSAEGGLKKIRRKR